MRILFYTPLNTRCRDIESQALAFRERGHEIFLLTQCAHGEIHRSFAIHGFQVFETKNQLQKRGYLSIFKRIAKLAKFCTTQKIDLVYSHLEPANFVAVLTQYIIKSRVVICRHHMDYARLNGFDKDRSYKLTYKLARDIIVVSSPTKSYMVREEGVSAEKIHVIKLAYNFGLYGQADVALAEKIRQQHPCDVMLITVCRLTPFKRPEVSAQLIRNLLNAGVRANLLILGVGEYKAELIQEIENLNVAENVFLIGYVTNVLDYLEAADVLVHPSVSESSCITIKEAGLVSLPIIACKHVGDFDDVVQHGHNGFLFDVETFLSDATALLTNYHHEQKRLKNTGKNLQKTIVSEFDIEKTVGYYERVFHKELATHD